MFEDASWTSTFFLICALGLALGFEFVNGFHDTANAVATVIYTHTLRPGLAVVWSGIWNLLGVMSSSGAVAFGVLALLPVELILNVGSAAGFAMVFSLLLSAILWNLGTWYLGLPASSSHTLIGSIMGVGIANAMMKEGLRWGDGVNWAKAEEVGISLLVSPLVGFLSAGLLLLAMKRWVHRADLYRDPQPGQPPPTWIRGILMLTCTGVSFAHGSNDGQKGMGLILLILIGILPGTYALNQQATSLPTSAAPAAQVLRTYAASQPSTGDPAVILSQFLRTKAPADPGVFAALAAVAERMARSLVGKRTVKELDKPTRSQMRSDIYLMTSSLSLLHERKVWKSPADRAQMDAFAKDLTPLTQYIPFWVKVAVALALGLGTMIGWERVVVTVGEKIGQTHLSYGQGAASEFVAATTIAAADLAGLPVSTTHVLSSAVAGTMTANGSGLQMDTVRNLALAWLLTMPVCLFLGALLFALGLNILAGLGLR
ncbi:MAG: inorganic phosphate transporter [Bryobacteraceae bacterium]|nr:inorganic phosphate transporter [Bryobacteraceae bacterium]